MTRLILVFNILRLIDLKDLSSLVILLIKVEFFNLTRIRLYFLDYI